MYKKDSSPENSLINSESILLYFLIIKLLFFSDEMDQDQIPPIETIHCIQYKKLCHINPLLHHQPNVELNQSIISSFDFFFHSNKIFV